MLACEAAIRLHLSVERGQVTAAVINGKIRMWEYTEKRWNGTRSDEHRSMNTFLQECLPQ